MRPSARLQAAAWLANQLRHGHAHGVQMNIAGVRLPGHGLVAADHFHAGCGQVHKEGADLPFGAALGAVEAMSTAKSANGDPEIKRLRPVST